VPAADCKQLPANGSDAMSADTATTASGSPDQAGASSLNAAAAGQIAQLGSQPEGKGDPNVETCFALGWHMAELKAPAT